MQNGTPAQVELLRSAIMQGTCDNIADVLEIIESTKAIAYTYEIAQQEAEEAIAMLTAIPESPYRAALFGLAKFVLARQN
jgi:octaprenyl-diphosphate synthase